MKIPAEPPVGAIIAYEYLWHSKAHKATEGQKAAYPCLVVLSTASTDNSKHIAYVLGISHMTPRPNDVVFPFDQRIAKHLGMDHSRPAWVYLDEVNIFEWVGTDVRQASHFQKKPGSEDTCVVGRVPGDWFKELQRAFHGAYSANLVTAIRRKNEAADFAKRIRAARHSATSRFEKVKPRGPRGGSDKR